MFTSSAPAAPETPYYGYLLASALAQPHALLPAIPTSDPTDVLAYRSLLPGGRHAVAFLNTNTSSAQTVTFHPGVPMSGQLQTETYSAGNQNAANSNIVTGTATARSFANGITLPAESMVILQSP
jgi:hypothetical protein